MFLIAYCARIHWGAGIICLSSGGFPALLLPAFGGRLGWGLFAALPRSMTLTLLARPAMHQAAFAARPPLAPIPAFPRRGKEQNGFWHRGDLSSDKLRVKGKVFFRARQARCS